MLSSSLLSVVRCPIDNHGQAARLASSAAIPSGEYLVHNFPWEYNTIATEQDKGFSTIPKIFSFFFTMFKTKATTFRRREQAMCEGKIYTLLQREFISLAECCADTISKQSPTHFFCNLHRANNTFNCAMPFIVNSE